METLTKSRYTNKVIGKTAFMLLNKPIGESSNKEEAISGPDFAEEVYSQKSSGNDVTIKINCMGGNVGHGWDMVDSIIETKAKTENVGFAYSMAGICLIVGSERTAYPHSRAMIHAPRTADGKKHIHTELVKDQFRTILTNHTKFTEAEINEMIDSGKDYFFTASQMLEKGMIDRVISTGYGNTNGLSDTQAYEYYNSLIEEEQETNNYEMEILAKLFGGKTESENLVSAVQMKADNDTLKSTNAQLDTENKTLKAEIETLKAEKGKSDVRAKATELINEADRVGKLQGITAADKQKWIDNATANFDLIKGVIETMPVSKSASVAAGMTAMKPGEGDMTYEWLAKNNPQELARIAESDPVLFGKLSAAYNDKTKESAK